MKWVILSKLDDRIYPKEEILKAKQKDQILLIN